MTRPREASNGAVEGTRTSTVQLSNANSQRGNSHPAIANGRAPSPPWPLHSAADGHSNLTFPVSIAHLIAPPAPPGHHEPDPEVSLSSLGHTGSVVGTRLPSTLRPCADDTTNSPLFSESPLTHGAFSLDTNATTPSSPYTINTARSQIQGNGPSLAGLSPTPDVNLQGTTIPETAERSCRYPILLPLASILSDIIPLFVACDLLQTYFNHPGNLLLKCTSPYVLTHVLRRRSVLRRFHPRPTSPALLLAMLYATAHTAEIACFQTPGFRSEVCDKLYVAVVKQLQDPHDWHRLLNGAWIKLGSGDEAEATKPSSGATYVALRGAAGPVADADELLTFTLLAIVVSGGTYKADCRRWWNKALQLAQAIRLFQLDEAKGSESGRQSFSDIEAVEEKRRICWLLFCLDRHFALSHNTPLKIPDADIFVYLPLSEEEWEDLEQQPLPTTSSRTYGPRTIISGTGFFDFFLPLMAILGDIVLLHHRRLHPRFGMTSDVADTAIVERLLDECECSLQQLQEDSRVRQPSSIGTSPLEPQNVEHAFRTEADLSSHTRLRLVTAYSTHILHVLAVLLFGKWDPLTMLRAASASSESAHAAGEDSDDWMTPTRFMKCASHAVSASQAVAAIIELDPELVFMPYLFGIYLLHGSFILLLFADRMPQLGGPNPDVEQACETIIRAHEICVVTLSTEFQRSFRRVLRSTLHSVRNIGASDLQESQARMRALEMYRWTRGGSGLAL